MIRVLIIDDDKLTRRGLISIVDWASCGMEIAGEAANGAKALAFLENEPVDLAVVDLTMPVMTGLEFIKESRLKWPELKYVVLSFHEDFDYVRSAMQLGALDYISKIRLEQQDCTEVFRKISAMFSKEEPHSNSGWVQIEKSWTGLYWLYSEDTLLRIWAKTRAVSPSARQMEHLLVRIIEAVRTSFPVETLPTVPELLHGEHALPWLLRLRDRLAEQMMNGKNTGMAGAMLAAARYMRVNFNKALSIADAASYVNMSRSHFAANFKKAAGMTFLQYIQSVRIAEAKRLLADHQISIEDVAQSAGYSDVKYFCKLFAQITGMNPGEYRAKEKG